MNWKQFLKPELNKIGLTLFLLFISSFVLQGSAVGQCREIEYYGFPLPWFNYDCITDKGVLCSDNQASCSITSPEISILVLDIIIWYIISCVIVWIYNKIKKR
jgi:hypothetical protein